jgi:hypothetical protein
MSPVRSSARRSLATSALLAGLLLVPGFAASAQDAVESAAPGSPAPAASPPVVSPSADPSASPAVAASPSVGDLVFSPLPESITVIPADVPTVSVEPESVEQLEIGQPLEYPLGHCGLWSPVDLDGSLWQAVGGVKADGSAIVEGDDEAIGELINATPGVFVLVDEDHAHFTTAIGSILEFVRAPGAVDYPLCM